MTKNVQSKKTVPGHSEQTVGFEVSEDGTLLLAGYEDPETRAEFYEDIVNWWEGSPSALADAMDECQPLAWRVQKIYSSNREDLQTKLQEAEEELEPDGKKINQFKARLSSMPEDPEEGAREWLLEMEDDYFTANIIGQIRMWFSEPPDWLSEGDYLPEMSTAQGIAMEYFQGMDQESLDLLGIEVTEGECPGNSYYAANLRIDIEEANAAAVAAGLLVRFFAAPEVDELE